MAGATISFFDADFLKRLERLHLIAKRLDWAGAGGEHAASRKGYSLEFSDYRRYQRGDDLRYVDWNIYRRLDRLVLKVFTAEEEMNIYLLVDTSASMAFRRQRPKASSVKIGYAKKVAAALGYIGLKNLDRVGGAAFSSTLRGAAQARAWTNPDSAAVRLSRPAFLRRCRPISRPPYTSSPRLFPQPGLAVIVSDLFDPAGWRAAVEELARKKYQVLVIHVLDEEEIEPARSRATSRWWTRRAGASAGCSWTRSSRAAFGRSSRSIFATSNRPARAWACDYLRTTTRVPFDEFILKSLRQVGSVS